MTSIEVISSEASSPFTKIALKTSTSNDAINESVINISKEKLAELLTGNYLVTLKYFKIIKCNSEF